MTDDQSAWPRTIRRMAYDEQLVERLREVVSARPEVTERKMFGGLCWFVGGNMAFGVMRHDLLVVRMDPAEVEEACREPHVSEFGRPGKKPMRGFVAVDAAALADDEALGEWVDAGAAWAASLPPK